MLIHTRRLSAPLVSMIMALLVFPSSARSGAPSIGGAVRADVGGGTARANETTISAADPYPCHVIAGWNDYRAAGVIRAGVGLSFDGGQTWSDFILRPPAGFGANTEGDPMTAYDHRTGTLWAGAIAFSGNGGVFVARKAPGSETLEPAVMAAASGGADKGWMAAGVDPHDPDRTRLYLAYNEGLIISTDMGDTWTAPHFLDSGLGFLPRVGPNGELYISYWEYDFFGAPDGMMLLRSFDGGLTFGPPIRIATRMDLWEIDGSRFPGSFRVPPLNYLAVDPNTGHLFCVYMDTTDIVAGRYNVDLYFAKSTDKGTSWTTPTVINNDVTPAADSFFPWLEVDRRGRIHLLFYDTRHVDQMDVEGPAFIDAYYSYSDDEGTSWTEVRLTSTSFTSAGPDIGFIGDYSGLAVAGTRAYPCYLGKTGDDSDIHTHVIIRDPGDFNCDGAIDLLDYARFAECVTGPDGELPAGCADQDIDDDGDVDLFDMAQFQSVLPFP